MLSHTLKSGGLNIITSCIERLHKDKTHSAPFQTCNCSISNLIPNPHSVIVVVHHPSFLCSYSAEFSHALLPLKLFNSQTGSMCVDSCVYTSQFKQVEQLSLSPFFRSRVSVNVCAYSKMKIPFVASLCFSPLLHSCSTHLSFSFSFFYSLPRSASCKR